VVGLREHELRAQLGGTFTPVAADATDPVVAGQLLDKHRPRTLVLNAGAVPLARPPGRLPAYRRRPPPSAVMG
jgi:hypothetical protein